MAKFESEPISSFVAALHAARTDSQQMDKLARLATKIIAQRESVRANESERGAATDVTSFAMSAGLVVAAGSVIGTGNAALGFYVGNLVTGLKAGAAVVAGDISNVLIGDVDLESLAGLIGGDLKMAVDDLEESMALPDFISDNIDKVEADVRNWAERTSANIDEAEDDVSEWVDGVF